MKTHFSTTEAMKFALPTCHQQEQELHPILQAKCVQSDFSDISSISSLLYSTRKPSFIEKVSTKISK